ncbi:MAG: DUF4097 family beta strand repeat-containing protein [Alicyclobacillus herbarius]|uniref:SHOCT-like domain-containing protein n=1 Tax=Alicyclobacillus herbarius TaxID=122960 RepID=UPI002357AA6B|nr:DUF4097 family beta strand repeat-containing protein [Alicyclobacillus herbarius]MCL6631022.1 DUF4097 family beta strand repeat-containing protein [Alicyclobacillus herbarius]
MNERRKILELVQEGKLTAEQGEQLLQALDEKMQSRRGRTLDLKNLAEWKQLRTQWGTQLSSLLGQSLAEARRSLEHEMRNLNRSFSFGQGPTLAVSTDISLPATIKDLYVETKDGEIQVVGWEESYIRIHIRGRVRADDLSAARETLEKSLQAQQGDESYLLTILHEAKEGVVGAHLELSVPADMRKIEVCSQNGPLHADGVTASEIQMNTDNGGVRVHHCSVQRLRIEARNGSLDIHDSLSATTRSVYAKTDNGTIVIDGIPADTNASGIARSDLGRVEVTGARAQVEAMEPGSDPRQSTTRFQIGETIESAARIYCESHSGSVRIHA